jgi:hypothetical protein
MTYTPTLYDAATDLRRCIYVNKESYKEFFSNANKIIEANKHLLPKDRLEQIKVYLKKSQNNKLTSDQKKEHLLTAAIFLQNSYEISP